VAAEGGHVAAVSALLGAGAMASGAAGTAAFVSMCRGGHTEVVAQLVAAGVAVGGAAGTLALRTARGGEIKTMLRARGAGLLDECAAGDVAAVVQLLAVGADADAEVEERTPLSAAAEGGHAAVVEALLQAGASAAGTAALRPACEGRHYDIVAQLVAAGADAKGAARHLTRSGETVLSAVAHMVHNPLSSIAVPAPEAVLGSDDGGGTGGGAAAIPAAAAAAAAAIDYDHRDENSGSDSSSCGDSDGHDDY
jgi:ankyrin repeat protein